MFGEGKEKKERERKDREEFKKQKGRIRRGEKALESPLEPKKKKKDTVCWEGKDIAFCASLHYQLSMVVANIMTNESGHYVQ